MINNICFIVTPLIANMLKLLNVYNVFSWLAVDFSTTERQNTALLGDIFATEQKNINKKAKSNAYLKYITQKRLLLSLQFLFCYRYFYISLIQGQFYLLQWRIKSGIKTLTDMI